MDCQKFFPQLFIKKYSKDSINIIVELSLRSSFVQYAKKDNLGIMIQRAQSIYFLLAAISLFMTLFFGFAEYMTDDGNVLFNLYGVSENANEVDVWMPYKIVIPFIAALCLFNLLQYKNRKLQMSICKILYALLLTLIVVLFIDVYTLGPKIAGMNNQPEKAIGIGLYFPVIALPFVILAHRRIKKDEELVRSVDRLR